MVYGPFQWELYYTTYTHIYCDWALIPIPKSKTDQVIVKNWGLPPNDQFKWCHGFHYAWIRNDLVREPLFADFLLGFTWISPIPRNADHTLFRLSSFPRLDSNIWVHNCHLWPRLITASFDLALIAFYFVTPTDINIDFNLSTPAIQSKQHPHYKATPKLLNINDNIANHITNNQ